MEAFRSYQTEIILGLIAVVVVQFFMLLAMNASLSRTSKLVRSLLTGPGGEDLEGMLNRAMSESRTSQQRSDELEKRLQDLADEMRGCVQYMGLVRYDAYGDVSGAQSFSIAMLDDHKNGAILTGLLGRNDGRCYGKPIYAGQAEQALSDEESSALQMALNGGMSAGSHVLPARPTNGRRGILNRA